MSIYDNKEEETPVSKPKKTLVKNTTKKHLKKTSKPKKEQSNVKSGEPIETKDVAVVLEIQNTPAPITPPAPIKPQTLVDTTHKREPDYIKHLIECRCHLPQFENMNPIPNHKFIVFSELDDNDMFKPSYAQCNNCGIIHRVTEFQTSYTIKKEVMMSLPTIEDLKTTTPEWLSGILQQYQCDLHVWQEAKFILDNELWGRFVVLSKELDNTIVHGKVLHIIGTKLYKIENFERNDEDVRPY
jgi:hypothetical protein